MAEFVKVAPAAAPAASTPRGEQQPASRNSVWGSMWEKLQDNEDEIGVDSTSMVLTPAERARQRTFWVPEDEWQTCPKWIFFPPGQAKQAWDFLIMLCVLYSCIMVPYHSAFEEASGFTFWFEFVIQLIFLFDVAANFNTAILVNERWIVHRPRIATTYLSGWFWIDAPSSIPIEVTQEILERYGTSGSGTEEDGIESTLPLLRVLRLFKLLRLLKVLRLADFVDQLEDRFGVSLKALRMVNTVILLFVFCHFLACIFYSVSIASEEAAPKTWVSTFDGGAMNEPDTPMFDVYVVALFWAIGLVCGQNSNITAENMLERGLSVFVYVLTALFFAYIIAVVTDQLSSYVNDPTNKALDDLAIFVRFHRVPKDIEGRLKSYYTTLLSTRSMVDEQAILSDLTPSLRDEVMDHLLATTVRACPLLCPDLAEERLQAFQEAIYKEMKPLTFERQMPILRKNARTEDLYFLLKGQVHAVAMYDSAKHDNQPSLQHTLFPIQQVGAFFGEQCLMEEANEVDYLAASRIDLLVVSRQCLLDAATHLDDEARMILAEAVWSDILRKARLRLWGMRIALADLTERLNETRSGLFPAEERSERLKVRTAHIMQIWYLNIQFKRLRKLEAADMLPDLVDDSRPGLRRSQSSQRFSSKDLGPAPNLPSNAGQGQGGQTPAMMQGQIAGLTEKVDSLTAQMARMLEMQEAMQKALAPKISERGNAAGAKTK